MKEIVNVQIGQAGNRIGSKFWEVISNEHDIQPDGSYNGDNNAQLENISTYYNEVEKGKYVPRAILADFDPKGLNYVHDGAHAKLFKEENLIAGNNTCGNNYGKGYYPFEETEGNFVEKVFDSIRKEAEGCDSLNEFQLTHSIGGGTGSGFGALLLSKLREEFSGKNISTFTVIPSAKVSDTVIEPYNAILTLHHLAENADQTFCFDNESLFDICNRAKNISSPTYADLNIIAAQTMSGVTSVARFGGQSIDSFYSFPSVTSSQLHFYTLGVAPFFNKDYSPFPSYSAHELTKQLFDSKSILANADLNNEKCFGATVIFRGNLSEKDVSDAISHANDEKSEDFVKWAPKNIKSASYEIPQRGAPTSATLVANSSAIQQVFNRLSGYFDPMFARKAFMFWYTSQGMEETEFVESREKLKELVSEYGKQSGTVAE